MTVMPITRAVTQRGGAPGLLAKEYLWVVESAIMAQPRSHQLMIGPSEIGCPCARRLGYRLLGKDVRHREPNWRATVGTAIHAWLESIFNADNDRLRDLAPDGRWLIEWTVPVGTVNGETITGKCDCYDMATATVIDHKTCGKTRLDHYRRHGPDDQYRVQAHLYARGWINLGLPVDTVMIVFLPRDGQLTDAVVWWESYKPQIATDALDRLQGIANTIDLLGKPALQALPTADAFCWHCPYFRMGSTDLDHGCPGDPHMEAPAAPALTINRPQPQKETPDGPRRRIDTQLPL